MPESHSNLMMRRRAEEWLRRRYVGRKPEERRSDAVYIEVDIKELATVMSSYINDEVKALTKR